MSDDPNKKQNEGSSYSGQQKPGQQSEQQRDESAQKRPPQSINEGSQDRESEQGGQRRSS